jgi:hypothetical protein
MNTDEIKNEEGRHYLRTWIIALKAIRAGPRQSPLVEIRLRRAAEVTVRLGLQLYGWNHLLVGF